MLECLCQLKHLHNIFMNHDLHIEINKQLEGSNVLYKLQADLHKRHFEFNIRNYVMIRIRSERRLPGSASKM